MYWVNIGYIAKLLLLLFNTERGVVFLVCSFSNLVDLAIVVNNIILQILSNLSHNIFSPVSTHQFFLHVHFQYNITVWLIRDILKHH